jgi:c(7)-type cytochrome triheme protein
MRFALVVALAAACSAARADDPRPAPLTAPVGFDHTLHARDVDVATLPEIACGECHAASKAGVLSGRPGHAACLGACHGPLPAAREPQPIPPERMRVCNACHAETQLVAGATGKPTVAYPPYKKDLDFALQIGHMTHAPIACVQCHDKSQPVSPHRRCIACHDGGTDPAGAKKGFPMAECKRCHLRGSGSPMPVALATSSSIQVFVTTAFSHARHAARSPAGRACASCHAAILQTDDRSLPRPQAKSCGAAGCHDGTASFGITTSCTKCHKDVPAKKYDVYRHDEPFTHAGHDQLYLPWNRPCADCHDLLSNGEIMVRGHGACATCHEDDFGERKPITCSSCHNGSEPWRALVPDRQPRERTEFGAELDHTKHGAECTACHSLATAGSQLRPPRGHRACTGTGCHARTAGPEPRLDACTACHVRDLVTRRDALRRAVPWSVRATFPHAQHVRTRLGEVACRTCHDDVRSPSVMTLETPRKERCIACHDGKPGNAFKLTGTTCSRCHPKATPVPENSQGKGQ